MSPQGGDTIGSQLQRSLDLLHQLYLDVEPAGGNAFPSARVTPAHDTHTVAG